MSEKIRTRGRITTSVGDVATLVRGITYSKEQAAKIPSPDFKPILRANNINGTLNFNDLVFVPQHLIGSEQIIKTGDIIFAMSSGSKHLVGKSARARFDFDGSYGAFCGLLRAHKHMDKDFLYYVFQNNKFRRLISEVAKGSNINNLKRDHILDFEIALPPLPEQHRIVAKIEELFSELDKGIENLKTARAQLKVYRQALLKHAFEGKLTAQWRAENQDKLETAEALLKRIQTERAQHYQQQLTDWEASGKQTRKPKAPKTLPPLTTEELAELPELPEEWGWSLMGTICLESILGKMLDKEKNKGELRPYLRNINVRWGMFAFDNLLEMRFEESEYVRYGLLDGDLVVCEGGEPGRCAVWRKEFGQDMQIQKALHRIRFTNSINSSFVQKYFELCASNRRLEKMFTGTTIKHLTGEKLTRMLIPICSIDEQEEIMLALESKLSEADQLDQTITTSLQQAEALRQSILKKAFSGQLVPQDPRDEPASALLARISAEKLAQGNNGKKGRVPSLKGV